MSTIARDTKSHIADFRSAKQYAQSVIPNTPEEIFLQKPNADTWSPAECYDHLRNVGHMYLDRIRNAYASVPTQNAAADSFHHRWYWDKIINFLEPPYQFKMNTPSGFEPQTVSDLSKNEVLQNYITLQDAFIDLLQQHPNAALDQEKISSPVSRLIRMNMSEALAFTAAHQRRHMWQADQILKRVEPATQA
jgi:uncharacterized damage-inducible protein DinB